jgi:hypothetical protein
VGTSNPAWRKHQAAVAQQAAAAHAVPQTPESKARDEFMRGLAQLVQRIADQEGRLRRLAVWHAERCVRVVELKAELRAEWERAEVAEAKVRQFESQVSAQVKTNGRGKAPRAEVAKSLPTIAGVVTADSPLPS